jgi:hypothetical protein
MREDRKVVGLPEGEVEVEEEPIATTAIGRITKF